jgi:antitoxin HicB
MLYPATIRRDGDTFAVLFPDIPHAHTNGKSREDALAHAPDALQAAISMLMEKGLEIPAPSRVRRNAVLVPLPSVVASAKVELYSALRSAGVRKAELARRMGIHKQQVERMMDIDHTSRIEQLEAAFAALNKRLVVDILNAA